MRFVHILLAAQVSYGLAQVVRLKSVTPVQNTVDFGCSFTFNKFRYQCTRELNDTPQAELGQLFSFRLDCRGAFGDFQNLTLVDSLPVCAHLTYRKYGNSSVKNPISQLFPWSSDHIVTIEKGDVLDFQCVVGTLKLRPMLQRRNFSSEQVLEEEHFGRPLALLQNRSNPFGHTSDTSVLPFSLELLYLKKDREPCVQSLAKGHEWKMKVYKSKDLTYWVSYGSPVLKPQMLPEVKFSSELRGEVYRLDKDLLHLTVMEATSYNSWNKPQETQQTLVKLDDNFYGDGEENNHSFSVDFKLQVNPGLLRSDTKDVVVRLRLGLRLSGDFSYFNVTLPTNRDKHASRFWPWLALILSLVICLAVMTYVFRERLFMSPAFQRLWRRAAGLPSEEACVSIEMRR